MEYAGFWRRCAATFIDCILLWVPGCAFGIISPNIFFGVGFGAFLGFFYKPFFESSRLMGTPGKSLMGLVVLSEQGEPLTFKRACLRYFTSFLSAVFFYFGYIMQVFTARRQTFHDIVAEAVVIRRDTDPNLNYFTVWKEQVQKVFDRL